MKAIIVLLFSSFIVLPSSFVVAASTISTNNSFAYGANIGWMDCPDFARLRGQSLPTLQGRRGQATLNQKDAS